MAKTHDKTVYKTTGWCGFASGSNTAAVDVKDGKIARIRPDVYKRQIVKGAAGDLSEKIVRFFSACDVAVLQMCENEMILLPFDPYWATLERDVSLVVPYSEIESVKLVDDLSLIHI